MKCKPDGVIVQLGCGLETTCYRCNNGKTHWYAVDLPNVIAYRSELLPEPEWETYLEGDAFTMDWMKKARGDASDAPILITAGGLFHYFEEVEVLRLLQTLGKFGEIELVFDAVSKGGMRMMQSKYMKQIGHADARMYFYVDSAMQLASKLGGNAAVLSEDAYYRHISKADLKLSTRVSMYISDCIKMVKMIHLRL